MRTIMATRNPDPTAAAGRRFPVAVGAALLAFLFTGCISDEDERLLAFQERAAKYAPLVADDRTRLQQGDVRPGDTREMVWVAHGEPDRRRARVTAGQTNEVWVYTRTDWETRMTPALSPWRPVGLPNGRIVYERDPFWGVDQVPHAVEVLRVEFSSNRVVAVEQPGAPARP
jgi:hypothetical protein